MALRDDGKHFISLDRVIRTLLYFFAVFRSCLCTAWRSPTP